MYNWEVRSLTAKSYVLMKANTTDSRALMSIVVYFDVDVVRILRVFYL